jgi:hypothetical protein
MLSDNWEILEMEKPVITNKIKRTELNPRSSRGPTLIDFSIKLYYNPVLTGMHVYCVSVRWRIKTRADSNHDCILSERSFNQVTVK